MLAMREKSGSKILQKPAFCMIFDQQPRHSFYMGLLKGPAFSNYKSTYSGLHTASVMSAVLRATLLPYWCHPFPGYVEYRWQFEFITDCLLFSDEWPKDPETGATGTSSRRGRFSSPARR